MFIYVPIASFTNFDWCVFNGVDLYKSLVGLKLDALSDK